LTIRKLLLCWGTVKGAHRLARPNHNPYEIDALAGPGVSGHPSAPPEGGWTIAVGSRRTGGEPSVTYIGVNAYKKFCRVCVKNSDEIILDEFNSPNSRSDFTLPLDAIGGMEAKAVTESTSNLWVPLYTAFGEAGVQGVLANPRLKNPGTPGPSQTSRRPTLRPPASVSPKKIREFRNLRRLENYPQKLICQTEYNVRW